MFSALRADPSIDYPSGSLRIHLRNQQTPSHTQVMTWLVDLANPGDLELEVGLPHDPGFRKQNNQVPSCIVKIHWMKGLLLLSSSLELGLILTQHRILELGLIPRHRKIRGRRE